MLPPIAIPEGEKRRVVDGRRKKSRRKRSSLLENPSARE
jgi:hypothetical protein